VLYNEVRTHYITQDDETNVELGREMVKNGYNVGITTVKSLPSPQFIIMGDNK
jgi:hypothetical protein